jgi:hypothetical protein
MIFDCQSNPTKIHGKCKAITWVASISSKVRGVENEALEIILAIVLAWIGDLTKFVVEYFVVPYCAEAQLAYFGRNGFETVTTATPQNCNIFIFEFFKKCKKGANDFRIELHSNRSESWRRT